MDRWHGMILVSTTSCPPKLARNGIMTNGPRLDTGMLSHTYIHHMDTCLYRKYQNQFLKTLDSLPRTTSVNKVDSIRQLHLASKILDLKHWIGYHHHAFSSSSSSSAIDSRFQDREFFFLAMNGCKEGEEVLGFSLRFMKIMCIYLSIYLIRAC